MFTFYCLFKVNFCGKYLARHFFHDLGASLLTLTKPVVEILMSGPTWRRPGGQEARRSGDQEVRWARSQREANEVPTSRQTFQGADVLALLFLKRKEARASSTVTWTEPVHSVPSQCENQCQLIFQFQCSSVPVFQCHCLRPECHQSLHRAGAPGSRFPSGENSVARCPNNSVPGCRQQFWSSCL